MEQWYYLLYRFEDLHPEFQRNVYDSFYYFVYRDIYYVLKDHALTEDLIQETFLKVLAALQKHDVEKLPAWIKQVARNKTIDQLRKIQRQRERYIEGISDVNSSEDQLALGLQEIQLELEVENKVRDKLLHDSIAELRPDHRMLITLHYIKEMSYKEVAAALDMSEQAVRQRLYRARKKLLQLFLRKWV